MFKNISRQILEGLAALHEANIAHRDIACRNVLMAEGFIAKIADFGLSRKLKKMHHVVASNAKVPSFYTHNAFPCVLKNEVAWAWMPPEFFDSKKVHTQSVKTERCKTSLVI